MEKPRVIINIEEILFPPTSLFTRYIQQCFAQSAHQFECQVREVPKQEPALLGSCARAVRDASIALSQTSPDAYLCIHAVPVTISQATPGAPKEEGGTTMLLAAGARAGTPINIELLYTCGAGLRMDFILGLSNMIDAVRQERVGPQPPSEREFEIANVLCLLINRACLEMMISIAPSGRMN